MNQGRYVFTQLTDFLPRKNFEWLVKKYEGNKFVKSFTCWNHLLVLLFGQLSNREGLRDLIVTLTPFKYAFHHLGFGKGISRSNLGKANEVREVRIFQEFADRMVSLAKEKHGIVQDFFVSNNVYAFDSSTISLCLSVFWWTRLHHGKGGVKLHELYDVKTDIPAFSVITDASVHDSRVMKQIPYEIGSFYIFDRALFVGMEEDVMAATLWSRVLECLKRLLEVLCKHLGVTFEELAESLINDEHYCPRK